jgi:hypothetical protein
MSDISECNNCGQAWPVAALDPIQNYWERVTPGSIVPAGQCPNPDCRALCYPAYGSVYDLEQQLATMNRTLTTLQETIQGLLEWAAATGGWEAPVWAQARHALAYSRNQIPDTDEETNMSEVENDFEK